jgi:hypothetical protein
MKLNKNNYLFFCILIALIFSFYYSIKMTNYKPLIDLESIENKDVDSFRLLCMVYACDCPNWVDYKKYTDYQADTSANKKEFDVYFNDSYYIERNGAKDYPKENIGLIIDFFGKLDTTKRLSKEDIYMGTEPIKGKIMMYSRYKIIEQGLSHPYFPPEYTDSTDLGRPENQSIIPLKNN